MLRFHFNYIAPFYLVSVRFAFCFFLFASASSAGKELNQPNCCKTNQKTDPGGDSAKKMTKKKEKKNTTQRNEKQYEARFYWGCSWCPMLPRVVSNSDSDSNFVSSSSAFSWSSSSSSLMTSVRLSSVWLSWVGLSWAQLNWVGLGFGLGLVEKYLVGLCFVESVCSAFLFGCRCSGSDKYEKKTLWSFWSINK